MSPRAFILYWVIHRIVDPRWSPVHRLHLFGLVANVVNVAQSGFNLSTETFRNAYSFFPLSRSMGSQWRCVTILVGISK